MANIVAAADTAAWLAELTSKLKSPHAVWLAAPEVREFLVRIARGESSPEDVQRLTKAAPPEQRGRAPFIARIVRVLFVLHVAYERASQGVLALMRRAADGDRRAAVEALKLIVDKGLLDEPEPRLTGCPLERDWALELEPNEGILAHDVVMLPTYRKAVVALVAARDQIPTPTPAEPEQVAHALARALVAEVSR